MKSGTFAATRVLGWLLATASGACGMDAFAQTTTSPDAANQDIVVTAQKRSQSIQKVAASITALPTDALQERGVSSAEGLAVQVPGLQYGEHANSVLFAIRGISLDIATGAGEPSVATHIDGVYQPRASAPLIDLDDLGRVEVLRGPQGTLYGRNSTGGTINFISIAPAKQFEGGLTVGTGSFDRRTVRGNVSVPLVTDTVLLRLAGSFDQNDGFSRNLLTGNSIEGRKRYYGHADLLVKPVDDFTGELGAYYVDEKINGPVQYVFDQGPFFDQAFPGRNVQVTQEPYKVYNDLDPHTDRSMLLLNARLNWEISGALSLKSITGYVRNDYSEVFDGDGSSLNYIEVGSDETGPRTLDSWSISQEFNLSGRTGSLDFVTGLFYFHEQFKPTTFIKFPLGIPGFAPPDVISYAAADEKTDSYAAFADVTLHLTDRLRAVGGVRVSKDRKTYVQSFGFSLPGFPAGTGPGMACIDAESRKSWNAVTPKAGLQYDIAQGVMLYGQYQKGNKSGLFNLTVCGNRVDPEKVDSFEAGIKARLIGNTLTLNASAFHYDYKDLQVYRFATIQGVPTSILDNAATAKVDGAELEMTANPTRRVSVSGSLAYLDSRYEDYILGPGQDFSGNRLNRAPKWAVKTGAEYRLPLSGALSELSLRGELNLTDRLYFDPANSRSLSQPSTVIINVYATLATTDLGLTLRAIGRNLTNQSVRSAAFVNTAQNATMGFFGAPRTWALELSKQL